jgi:ERCC4-related helicase
MRTYQEELYDECTKQNIMCVLPTGSGKTLIAANVIKYVLKNENSTKQKYVVFLVCTSTLVDQQQKAIRDVVPSDKSVGGFTGGMSLFYDEKTRKLKNDVTIMTAALLLNALQSIPDLLSHISLLVLDECHNTRKDHPYRQLMTKHYLPMKIEGLPKPKILGLTASPAAKETIGETLIHLLQLCHDLDCRVRQVTRNNDELDKHVHKPDIQEILVDMDAESLELREFLRGILKPTKELIKDILQSAMSFEFGSDEYENAVKSMEEKSLDKDISISQWGLNCGKMSAKKLVTIMCKLNEALIILDNRSAYACWLHILEFIKESKQDQQLGKVLADVGVTQDRFALETLPRNCAKRTAVLKLLEKGATALIFVKSREDANELKPFIEQNLQLKCQLLLGHGSMYGMSSFKQVETVKAFREGKLSVLIATSVAEEGLDIPSCGMVIRMHGVNTALELIQSRGRARNKESQFYSIYHNGSYDLVNLHRCKIYEKKMKHAIDALSVQQVAERLERTIFSPQSVRTDMAINLSSIIDLVWENQENIQDIIASHENELNDLNVNQTANEPIQLLTATLLKLTGEAPQFIDKQRGLPHNPLFTGIWKVGLANNEYAQEFQWPLSEKDYSWCSKKSDAKSTMAQKFLDELKKRDLIVNPKTKSVIVQMLESSTNSTPKKKKGKVVEVRAKDHVTPENAIAIINNFAQTCGFKINIDFHIDQGYFVCVIKLEGLVGTSSPCTTKVAAKKDAAMKLILNSDIDIVVPHSVLQVA